MNLKLFCFTLFLSFALNAQEPVSIHLTEKDGLPDIEFYDILEDKQGFVWLAADKGLYRYDGKNYKLYSHPLKRGRSLFYLTLDAKGRIWCNNLAGQFFYVENDELVLFKDFEFINTLADFNIYKDHLIIRDGNEVYAVKINSGEIVNTVEDSSGDYLLDLNNSSNGIYLIKNQLLYYTEDPTLKDISPISKDHVSFKSFRGSNKYFEYKKNIYFFQKQLTTTDENALYYFKNKELKQIKLPKDLEGASVVHSYQIGENLWVLTHKGVYVLNIENEGVIILNHYLKDIFITDVMVDRNQNFWVSTLNKGVYILPNPELKRLPLPKEVGVTSMDMSNQKDLYFATSQGRIYKYIPTKETLVDFDITLKNNVYGVSKNPYSQDVLIVANAESIIYNELNKSKKKMYY